MKGFERAGTCNTWCFICRLYPQIYKSYNSQLYNLLHIFYNSQLYHQIDISYNRHIFQFYFSCTFQLNNIHASLYDNFIIKYTYPIMDIYFNVKFLAHFNFTIYMQAYWKLCKKRIHCSQYLHAYCQEICIKIIDYTHACHLLSHGQCEKMYIFHMTTFMLHGAILYFQVYVYLIIIYKLIVLCIPVVLLINCFIRPRFNRSIKWMVLTQYINVMNIYFCFDYCYIPS